MPVVKLIIENPRAEAVKLARECFDKAGGYRDPAFELLRKRLYGDKRLFAALVDALIADELQALIGRAAAEQKERIARAARPDPDAPWTPPENAGSGLAARRHNDETIFDYQLYGGKKIGEATLPDIARDWRFRGARRAQDKAKRALMAWLKDALHEQPTGCRVQDMVTAKDLAMKFSLLGIET